MFKIDRAILITKDRTNFIILHVIEILKNKLPLSLSITKVIKTSLTLVKKLKINNYLVLIHHNFNLRINIHITLIMVLIRTKSTRYTTNSTFGVKKNIKIVKKKKNKKKKHKDS